ncbi:MAG TPA: phage terminase small subunit P27 family [Rhodocyclaceae bacterium]|jgi:P27 family predicted phage terminase small subunit
MGSRGPQPQSATVHLLRGNPSKKPLQDLLDEFKPEVEIPDAPSWLWAEAKKEWKRISPELEKYGLISKLDRSALVLYCQAWAEYVWHKQMLTRAKNEAARKRKEAEDRGETYTGGDGVMVPTPNGGFTYSHHWVGSRHASREVKMYLDMFGLHPAARSRVTTSDNRQQGLFEEAGDDKWDY